MGLVQVRRARPEDVDEVLGLFEAVASERQHILTEPPIDGERRRKHLFERIESDDACVFVAEAGTELVGELVVFRGGTTGPGTIGMSVAAPWRSRGVGSGLMQACVDWARDEHVHKLSLEVFPWNDAAIALYRKFGFAEEGLLREHYRRGSGERWDVVVMGLVLET